MKKFGAVGLVLLLVAMILYVLGNTLWIGFAVVGFIVEILGWISVVGNKNE